MKPGIDDVFITEEYRNQIILELKLCGVNVKSWATNFDILKAHEHYVKGTPKPGDTTRGTCYSVEIIK
jgi:hypothetical protein